MLRVTIKSNVVLEVAQVHIHLFLVAPVTEGGKLPQKRW